MRGFAGNAQVHRSNTSRGECHAIGFDLRGFTRKCGIVFCAKFREIGSGRRRADFFVTIDQYSDLFIPLKVGLFQDFEGVQYQSNPLFVIRYAKSISTIVIDPKGLLSEHAL